MSRDSYRGPKLPRSILDQVQNGHDLHRKRPSVSRKDQRKAEREAKKSDRTKTKTARRSVPPRRNERASAAEEIESEDDDDAVVPQPAAKAKQQPEGVKPLRSILKRRAAPFPESTNDPDDNVIEGPPVISRGVKQKLADDDAEIAALEKKLGIKGRKSKALESDGLDWLVDGSDAESDDGFKESRKRKRPEDDKWLKDKRLRASSDNTDRIDQLKTNEVHEFSVFDGGMSDDGGLSDMEDGLDDFDVDVVASEDFEGFESEDDDDSEADADHTPQPGHRPRENPYVAPVTNASSKYIPPSLRKPADSEEESLKQLRRQMQGQLNRLSEANMLSILKAIEDLYSKHPRQHVTSTMIDLLLGLICDPSTLNDTFLILHAGFSTALYKAIGIDFGALLLERLVERIDSHRRAGGDGKQTLNLLAFLSSLYTFQLVGSGLVFDYIRMLLEEVSENNTELLLRIIRTSGQQLRQDDPSSLKDIVLLLQRSIGATGEKALSVRTKFMVETINDLKNNRMKTGAAGSAIASEHTTRMKKTLGSLNASRSIRATEPLRITLSDIRDSDKKGKWWLVGASYLDPHKSQHRTSDTAATKTADADDAGYESESPGSVNLHKLARSQGMNTDVRRAIFVALLSSADYEEAHLSLLKLRLKSKQQLEIPRVLVHCVGAEQAYNPFYALVARKFCSEHVLRKAFQFALWDAFQAMSDDGDGDDAPGMEMNRIVNLGKMYGSLVTERGLDVRVLKKLDFTYLSGRQAAFVEVFLTTVFVQAAKKSEKEETGLEELLRGIFMRAAGVEGLPQGLHLVVAEVVAKATLANGKREERAVQRGCEIAVEVLKDAAGKEVIDEDDGAADDDGDDDY